MRDSRDLSYTSIEKYIYMNIFIYLFLYIGDKINGQCY